MIFKFKSLVLFYFFIYSSLLNGQTIISVVPNSGNSGTSLTAAITGQNTVFMNGSPMGILINYSVKARICTLLEEYNYSLAKFYEYGIDDFGMLLHYKG